MSKRPFNQSLVPRDNHGAEVTVPRSYNSDRPPVLGLRSMQAHLRSEYDQHEKIPKTQAPLRLTLELNANAEAVKRLAAFFGLYDPEEWNRYARANDLPLAPELPVLEHAPAAPPMRLLPGASGPMPPFEAKAWKDQTPFPDPSDTEPAPGPECSSCGHSFHDGRCVACDCLGDGFGAPR